MAALLCAVMLAACDSGLTRQQYVSRANDICRRANEQIEELNRPSDPDQLDAYISRLQAITARLIEELRGLEPPDQDQERIDRMLSNLEQMRSYLPQIESASQERDTQRIEELAAKVGESTREVEAIARDLGLDECSGEAVSVP